ATLSTSVAQADDADRPRCEVGHRRPGPTPKAVPLSVLGLLAFLDRICHSSSERPHCKRWCVAGPVSRGCFLFQAVAPAGCVSVRRIGVIAITSGSGSPGVIGGREGSREFLSY